MFNEALQDLKDKYKNRLTLIHILSRQAQEVPMLEGRIDATKVQQLIDTLLPARSMDEVFVCGPEAMIEDRIYSERFTSPTLEALSTAARRAAVEQADPEAPAGQVELTVVIDGKQHELSMRRDQHVLDVALSAGLDLPYSCKAGVCCTCRAKVLDGSVSMDKNFTLEEAEMAQGFVLSCQARPTTDRLTVSYDER